MILGILLCFRQKYPFTMISPIGILPTFGFQSGGTFAVKIKALENTTRTYQFAFLTSKELRDVPQCGAPTLYPHFIWKYSTQENWLNGTIKDKAILYPVMRDCYPGDAELRVNIEVYYKNPNSYLDYREQPSLITGPIILGVACSAILFWLIYNIIRRCKFVPLHYAFTVLFVLFAVLILIEYLYLQRVSKYDGSLVMSIAFDVIDVIYLASLFGTIIMVASGWCFIHTDFSFTDILVAYIAPALLFGLENGAHYSNSIWLATVILVGEFAAIAFCVYVAIKRVGYAKKVIMAHMTVIEHSGIDPSTTPISKKFKVYTNVFNTVLISIFIYFLTVSIVVVVNGGYWIRDLVSAFLQITIYSVVGYNFRPVPDEYSSLFNRNDNDDDTQRMVVELDDIDDNIIYKKGVGKEWHPGDKLPKEPIIASKEPKKQPLLAGYTDEKKQNLI